MKRSLFVSASLLAIATSAPLTAARGDSAEATCQLHGPGSHGISTPCTFSQRQGYIDVSLQNGGTYSFSPGRDSSDYRDSDGERVDRTLLVGDSQEFRWKDGRTLTVTQTATSPHRGNDGGIAMTDMPKFCTGEASEKFGVNPRDITTEAARQTKGMYEVWGQYGERAQVFICSFNAEREFLSVDKYQP